MLGFGLKKKREVLAGYMHYLYDQCFEQPTSPVPNINNYKTAKELLAFCGFCWFMTIPNSKLGQMDQHRMQLHLRDNVMYLLIQKFFPRYVSKFIDGREYHAACRDELEKVSSFMQTRAMRYKELFEKDKRDMMATDDEVIPRLYMEIWANIIGNKKKYNQNSIVMNFLASTLERSCVILR